MKKQTIRDERGQSIVLIAVVLVAMIGFAGVVIDGGREYVARRHSQNASDAAAFAGVQTLANNTDPSCLGEAQIGQAINNYAVQNGAASADDVLAYFMDHGTQIDSPISADCGHSINNGVPSEATGVSVTVKIQFQPFFINLITGNGPVQAQANTIAQSGQISQVDSIMPIIVKNENYQPGDVVQLFGDSYGPGSFSWTDFDFAPGHSPCSNPSDSDLSDSLQVDPTKLSGPRDADPEDQHMDWQNDDLYWMCTGVGVKASQASILGDWINLPEDQRHWIVPLFDVTNGKPGFNLEYHIVGFAEFIMSGFNFGNGSGQSGGEDTSCDGTHKCINGRFVKFTQFNHGGTQRCQDGIYGCSIWFSQ